MERTIDVEERLRSIVNADDAEARKISADIFEGISGTQWLGPEALVAICLIPQLLKVRPDLGKTGLWATLNYVAGSAFAMGEDAVAPGLRSEITNNVRKHLHLWVDQITDPSNDLGDRIAALHVVSMYEPRNEAARREAVAILERAPRRDGLWYVAFNAARALLAPGREWQRLIQALLSTVEPTQEAEAAMPFPSPEISILVAAVPYVSSNVDLIARLDQLDPSQVAYETRYLARDFQIPLLRKAVCRINEMDSWSELNGFPEIYYLLHAIFMTGLPEPDYVAEIGRVMFKPPAGPPQDVTQTAETIEALGCLVHCRRLWTIKTNLPHIFGLPATLPEFKAWLLAMGRVP